MRRTVTPPSYDRDALSRITAKRVDGVKVKGWIYKDALKPIAETDAAGNVVSFFVYGTSALSPDTMDKDGTTYRFIRDVQGSVRLVVDSATGAIAQRLDYDSFGNVLLDTNPGFQPFGFQSGLYDPDTALVQFGARWYDASTGRWLSKDPILLEGGLNLYVFCGNDPVNFADPWGLCEEGEQALSWAKSEVGNESYSGTGNLPGPFGPGDPKCNIFVAHAYNKGNGKTIIPTGFWGSRPPKARDWFTNNVPPGFTLTTTPRPGDVISDGHHMGLVSEHGKSTVSAATALGVVENSWGYRTNSRPNVYYHYDGGR